MLSGTCSHGDGNDRDQGLSGEVILLRNMLWVYVSVDRYGQKKAKLYQLSVTSPRLNLCGGTRVCLSKLGHENLITVDILYSLVYHPVMWTKYVYVYNRKLTIDAKA